MKTMLLTFSISACIICACGVSTNLTSSPITKRGININIDFDVVAAIKYLSGGQQDCNREHFNQDESHAGFTKGLANTLAYNVTNGTNYGIMIYNMGQEYTENLRDVVSFNTATHGSLTYGIWIFRCGEFKNRGKRGYRNWAYNHPCLHTFWRGSGVHFESADCSDKYWTETWKC